MAISKKKRLEIFYEIYFSAQKKYGSKTKRLAGEAWPKHWQTLIATIFSAQTKDETTIPVAEKLFSKYITLTALANADYDDVLRIIKPLNYNKTKAKHAILAAKHLLDNHKGLVPSKLEDLVKIPGAGRKTANLVLSECFGIDSICVDVHVHKIVNIFGVVNTKNPTETELELMKLVPKKYWSSINRLFVLWGKDVPRKSKEALLVALE